jgi:hypothetical protein
VGPWAHRLVSAALSSWIHQQARRTSNASRVSHPRTTDKGFAVLARYLLSRHVTSLGAKLLRVACLSHLPQLHLYLTQPNTQHITTNTPSPSAVSLLPPSSRDPARDFALHRSFGRLRTPRTTPHVTAQKISLFPPRLRNQNWPASEDSSSAVCSLVPWFLFRTQAPRKTSDLT